MRPSADPLSGNPLLCLPDAPSPLRYPGGKSRAIPIIGPLLIELARRARAPLLSPFLGGGSLEITCALNGMEVEGADISPPLVNFWHFLLHEPGDLATQIETHLDVNPTQELLESWQADLAAAPIGLEAAAKFYAINKWGRDGLSMLANLSSQGAQRLTVSGILKVREFRAPGLSVACRDFRDTLAMSPSLPVYCDPPYWTGQQLYQGHRDFDHEDLHDALKDRQDWILSYNGSPEVLALYEGFPFARPTWRYDMSETDSNEVLIFATNLTDLTAEAQAAIAASDRVREQRQVAGHRIVGPWSSPDFGIVEAPKAHTPSYPLETLGDELAAWIEKSAHAANAPIDYCALALLVICAGLTGNAVRVRAGTSFTQPAVLWGCNVGGSGSNKTPALNAVAGIAQCVEAIRGTRRRLSNATAAAAIQRAAQHPQGLYLSKDELARVWESMRREQSEDVWLEAYTGGPLSVDRKNEPPIDIDRFSISMVGGAQPDVVRGVTTNNKHRGFSARLHFAYPEPVDGYSGDAIAPDAEWAVKALGRLADLGATRVDMDLDPEAHAVFTSWWNATLQRSRREDGFVGEWLAKQGGAALRFALVLELLKWCGSRTIGTPQRVSRATLEDAIRIIDNWAAPHFDKTMGAMHNPRSEQMGRVLAQQLKRARLTEFNARLLRRGSYGSAGMLQDEEALTLACKSLVEAGLIRPAARRAGPTRGRLSRDFEVNPQLLADR